MLWRRAVVQDRLRAGVLGHSGAKRRPPRNLFRTGKEAEIFAWNVPFPRKFQNGKDVFVVRRGSGRG